MTADSRVRELEGRGPLRYGVHSYRATDQSINTATITGITWSSDVEDDFGFRSGGSDATRFKVPIGGTGLYVAELGVFWDGASSVTNPQIACYVRDTTGTIDTTRSMRGTFFTITAGVGYIEQQHWLVDLPEAYEVQPWVYHASAAARNIEGVNNANGTLAPYFKLYRVSR